MAKKFYTLKDGTVQCYNDTGAGRPVLFIHGWGENKSDWDAYETIISEAGYRFIGIDMRGSKETSASKTRPVTVYTLVDDLQDLIEGLDLEDVTLIGHSLGVSLILDYVSRYGNGYLRSIALMDAPPLQTPRDDYKFALWNGTFTEEKAYFDCDWMDRDMLDYLKNWIKNSNPEIKTDEDAEEWSKNYMSRWVVPGEIAEIYRSTIAFDCREKVASITVPVRFYYPDPGSICRADLWTWYRDHLVNCRDFSKAAFPATSHFFCVEPEHIPAVSRNLLGFLKK